MPFDLLNIFIPQSRDRAFCGKAHRAYCDCPRKVDVRYDESDLCKDTDGCQGTLKRQEDFT